MSGAHPIVGGTQQQQQVFGRRQAPPVQPAPAPTPARAPVAAVPVPRFVNRNGVADALHGTRVGGVVSETLFPAGTSDTTWDSSTFSSTSASASATKSSIFPIMARSYLDAAGISSTDSASTGTSSTKSTRLRTTQEPVVLDRQFGDPAGYRLIQNAIADAAAANVGTAAVLKVGGRYVTYSLDMPLEKMNHVTSVWAASDPRVVAIVDDRNRVYRPVGSDFESPALHAKARALTFAGHAVTTDLDTRHLTGDVVAIAADGDNRRNIGLAPDGERNSAGFHSVYAALQAAQRDTDPSAGGYVPPVQVVVKQQGMYFAVDVGVDTKTMRQSWLPDINEAPFLRDVHTLGVGPMAAEAAAVFVQGDEFVRAGNSWQRKG